MTVRIVMGIPCSGKSTFIKKYFPNSLKIDLYDFQKKYKTINISQTLQSYEDTQNAFINAIKESKDVILEHTLLKAIRREPCITALREVTDEPIDIYLIHPSTDRLKENHVIRFGDEFSDRDLELYYELLEIPTKEEGFNNVYIIENINDWSDVDEKK